MNSFSNIGTAIKRSHTCGTLERKVLILWNINENPNDPKQIGTPKNSFKGSYSVATESKYILNQEITILRPFETNLENFLGGVWWQPVFHLYNLKFDEDYPEATKVIVGANIRKFVEEFNEDPTHPGKRRFSESVAKFISTDTYKVFCNMLDKSEMWTILNELNS